MKVFLAGINILGRRDWTMKKVREMPLKVKRRRSAIPQAYELSYNMQTFEEKFEKKVTVSL